MRVGVEEAVDHDLACRRTRAAGARASLRAGSLGARRDRAARHVAHHQEARRRVVARTPPARAGARTARSPRVIRAHVARLLPEVELAVQRRRTGARTPPPCRSTCFEPGPVTRPSRRTPRAAPGPARSAPSRRAAAPSRRPSRRSASVARCTCGDRAGRERLRLDVIEHVLPRDAQLLLHHADDLLLGERRHVVLQRRELLDELGRQQVGRASRGSARASRTSGPAPRARARSRLALALAGRPAPVLVRAGRTAPSSPCLAKTVAILRAARHQVRLGLGLDAALARIVAGRRPRRPRVGAAASVVFTMITVQRALWLMRFGTLPSRNSLRPAMPALPTTRTSISCSSVACDDRHGAGRRRSPRGARPRSPATWRRVRLQLVARRRHAVTSAVPDCGVASGCLGGITI